MRLNKGVEWAAHACALLAPLSAGRSLSAAALAEFHGVPTAYMAKQMQLLSTAGLVRASRGAAAGGYSLARAPADISLWDIKQAIDAGPAFRCEEIRRQGPCALSAAECRTPCAIAAAFHEAEAAYRKILEGVSLVQIVAGVAAAGEPAHLASVMTWYGENTKTANSA